MKKVVIVCFALAFIEIMLFILMGAIIGSSILTLTLLFAGCITAVFALVFMAGYMLWKVIRSK